MRRMPARRSSNVKSPGKGGVKHDIKKPATLKSIKKEKPNIVARLTSLRSSKRNILCEITNDESVVKIENVDEIVKEEPPKEVKSEVKHVTKKKKEAEFHQEKELCEYEKIRLQNILERQAMFEKLGLATVKHDLSEGLTPSRPKHNPSSRGLASEKKPKEILPPRKSARLAGGLVPEIERYVPLVEETYEPEIASLETLTVEDCFNNADDDEFVTHNKTLLTELSKSERVKKISFEGDSCDERLSKISIEDNNVAKVVPDRIFSLSLHPGHSQLVCAVGGKAGHVGLWDIRSRDSRYNDGVHVYHPHSRPVNTLTWDQWDSGLLISTSYDGTSRTLDCEKQCWSMLYGDKVDIFFYHYKLFQSLFRTIWSPEAGSPIMLSVERTRS